MPRDLRYESANIGYDWQNPDGGIKCKNYILCESILPELWYECKASYICSNCDIMFGPWIGGKGELPLHENIDCPVCLETDTGIEWPKCAHTVCVSCFKKCYMMDPDDEPQFPYSEEIEDAYYSENADMEQLETMFPLIKKYNQQCDKWYASRQEQYEKTYNLRKCPLCRK
jgi:hypothetical protein